eukprot:NODE_1036_length_511_cov_189.283854_g1026_i0.p2 GENE.NODE_1036_length_511_cov_189.283854_g1026_i0~~NODE_1036_length_511_cov_189.283854_g1026_i0.p2  ORF type:complete len:58 (+),score=9.20 NODE_1036_length_511_cov_189.283854_g1026_i0:154-327(+)
MNSLVNPLTKQMPSNANQLTKPTTARGKEKAFYLSYHFPMGLFIGRSTVPFVGIYEW